MDTLSLSTGAAGLLSLAIEVTRILHNYISGVRSAPQDASELNTEDSALCHVLVTLVEDLRNNDINTKGKAFDDQSILRAVITECQKLIAAVYKKISKLKSTDKTAVLIARITWPFQKEEYQEAVRTLHRYVQTLQVLLIASNGSLLSESFTTVIAAMEEQHKRAMGSIEMMNENLIAVPEGMFQISEKLENAITLVSDLASSSAEIRNISKEWQNYE